MWPGRETSLGFWLGQGESMSDTREGTEHGVRFCTVAPRITQPLPGIVVSDAR